MVIGLEHWVVGGIALHTVLHCTAAMIPPTTPMELQQAPGMISRQKKKTKGLGASKRAHRQSLLIYNKKGHFHTPKTIKRYEVRTQKVSIFRYLSWYLVWIAGSARSLIVLFASGAPVTSERTLGSGAPSLDFAVSGADSQLGGLMIARITPRGHPPADGGIEDRRSAKNTTGFVVVGSSNPVSIL